MLRLVKSSVTPPRAPGTTPRSRARFVTWCSAITALPHRDGPFTQAGLLHCRIVNDPHLLRKWDGTGGRSPETILKTVPPSKIADPKNLFRGARNSKSRSDRFPDGRLPDLTRCYVMVGSLGRSATCLPATERSCRARPADERQRSWHRNGGAAILASTSPSWHSSFPCAFMIAAPAAGVNHIFRGQDRFAAAQRCPDFVVRFRAAQRDVVFVDQVVPVKPCHQATLPITGNRGGPVTTMLR